MTFAILTYWLTPSGVLRQHKKQHSRGKEGKTAKNSFSVTPDKLDKLTCLYTWCNCIFVGCMHAFDPFSVHVCLQAQAHKACVCARVCMSGFGATWRGVVAVGVWGGCDRQRSHLTLHVPNRLKEFFPDSAFPHCCLKQNEHL